ncbi:MAG: hypothetical protein VKQ33_11960 [Candidatus Sericytochromatia bacterium]|nr:hypothetical protein [Candidatus Sericytochromatia bacterium]
MSHLVSPHRPSRLPRAPGPSAAGEPPVAPSPDLRCRDGHHLIDDWRAAEARILAARAEARKARQVATTLTTIGGLAALGGVASLAFSAPIAAVSIIVGVGLVAASSLLRLASASKVAAVTRRALAAYERSARSCDPRGA